MMSIEVQDSASGRDHVTALAFDEKPVFNETTRLDNASETQRS